MQVYGRTILKREMQNAQIEQISVIVWVGQLFTVALERVVDKEKLF